MTERPNIRRLQVPDQKEKLASRFDDVETVLRKNHEKMILELRFTEIVAGADEVRCMKMAADLHLLFPKDPIRYSPELQNLFQAAMRRARIFNDRRKMWDLALCLKVLDPAGPEALRDEDWIDFKYKLDETQKGRLFFHIPQMLQVWKILFPDKKLELPQKEKTDMVKYIKEANTSVEWAKRAAGFRIVFPEDPVEVSNDHWQRMREALDIDIGADNFFALADLAADMKILTAEGVRIPPGGGLELIMHTPKGDSKEPVPTRPHSLEL